LGSLFRWYTHSTRIIPVIEHDVLASLAARRM
jgi:hypothetical protein